MSTDSGENLLNPGDNPHDNAQFLVFCSAVIRAVDKYAELLRVSVASAHNDHRLGANEAPPAIISIFLGDQLNDIFEQIEKGGAKSSRQGGTFDIGLAVLPKIPKEAGDRNRTSPFAFTGNKFEFRAVGSSFNIAGPNTVLNAMVAESLDYIATELEKSTQGGKGDVNKAIQELLPKIIKQHKRVIFNGDNYTEEWHSEAEKRGLANLKSTIECLPVLQKKEVVDLLTKYKVYTAKELESRFNILSETYVKTITIEANMMLTMAKTMILPAALRYQKEVGESIAAAKAAGANSPAGLETFGLLVSAITDFQRNIGALEKAAGHHAEGGPYDHAKQLKEQVVPAMVELRKTGDKLETMVADDLWPLPTYREMLFIK
jgi:glutamine synthetase